MVVDTAKMVSAFWECNMKYFNNELPLPNFDLLHSFITCGYFRYTKGGWFDNHLYEPTILITDYYDFTPGQFEELMCHEMIHYYLAYTGKDRNCRHGKEFKIMASIFELNYGINITTNIDLSKYKRRSGTPTILYWLSRIY